MHKHGIHNYIRLSRDKKIPELCYKTKIQVHKSVEQPIHVAFLLQSHLCPMLRTWSITGTSSVVLPQRGQGWLPFPWWLISSYIWRPHSPKLLQSKSSRQCPKRPCPTQSRINYKFRLFQHTTACMPVHFCSVFYSVSSI